MLSSQKKTKLCPHLKKSCIEDNCTHWVGYPAERRNELTGSKVIETVYMCNDLWATKIAFDAARFADYAGASLDSLRNHVAEGNAAIGGIIFETNQRLRHAKTEIGIRDTTAKQIDADTSGSQEEGRKRLEESR